MTPRVQQDYRAAIREEYNDIQRSGRTEFWNPRTVTANDDDGDRIRIIVPPYIEPDPEFGVVLSPWVKYRTYKVLGIDGLKWGKNVVVASDYDQPDPIAEAIQELEEGTKNDRALARKMSPRQQFIALIVDLDNDPEKVQPWQFGKTVAEQILKFATARGYNLPWDIDEGHDLWVRKTGEGLDTEYEITPDPRPSPLPDGKKVLAEAGKIDLARFVVVETEETMLDLLDGKYDKDAAKESRIRRDELHGRPFPYFLKSSGDGAEETTATPPRRTRTAAADPQPAPVTTARRPPKDVEVVEEAPAAPAPAATRRRRTAPEPEPAAPTQPALEDTVEFLAGDTGQNLQGQVIELHYDDPNPYCTVDTGDGGEPWDVNVDELTVVRRPAQTAATTPAEVTVAEDTADLENEDPAEAAKRRKRERERERRERKRAEAEGTAEAEAPAAPARRSPRAAAAAENVDEAPATNGATQSIVDRVAAMSRTARGGR